MVMQNKCEGRAAQPQCVMCICVCVCIKGEEDHEKPGWYPVLYLILKQVLRQTFHFVLGPE